MAEFWETINLIKKGIEKGLPGPAAQNRMAPTLPGGFLLKRNPDNTTLNSAVLVILFPFENRVHTLFIKRATYDGAHSGQVSFPGGKAEESDIDINFTAIREAKEEVGIDPSEVSVIGNLTPLFVPVSNLMVYPVVGVLEKEPVLHLNVQEVEYTFQVDIEDFKISENRSVNTICINNFPISAPFYSVSKEQVWGITAMIISELTELY